MKRMIFVKQGSHMDRSSEKELERIARLSGLTLSEEEKDILFSDLSRIVPYMERISELDTSGAGKSSGSFAFSTHPTGFAFR